MVGPPPPRSTLFPYTTLFRSKIERVGDLPPRLIRPVGVESLDLEIDGYLQVQRLHAHWADERSEEHTSELQSLRHLVCRLLLEKKKATATQHTLTLGPGSLAQ